MSHDPPGHREDLLALAGGRRDAEDDPDHCPVTQPKQYEVAQMNKKSIFFSTL